MSAEMCLGDCSRGGQVQYSLLHAPEVYSTVHSFHTVLVVGVLPCGNGAKTTAARKRGLQGKWFILPACFSTRLVVAGYVATGNTLSEHFAPLQ